MSPHPMVKTVKPLDKASCHQLILHVQGLLQALSPCAWSKADLERKTFKDMRHAVGISDLM